MHLYSAFPIPSLLWHLFPVSHPILWHHPGNSCPDFRPSSQGKDFPTRPGRWGRGAKTFMGYHHATPPKRGSLTKQVKEKLQLRHSLTVWIYSFKHSPKMASRSSFCFLFADLFERGTHRLSLLHRIHKVIIPLPILCLQHSYGFALVYVPACFPTGVCSPLQVWAAAQAEPDPCAKAGLKRDSSLTDILLPSPEPWAARPQPWQHQCHHEGVEADQAWDQEAPVLHR